MESLTLRPSNDTTSLHLRGLIGPLQAVQIVNGSPVLRCCRASALSENEFSNKDLGSRCVHTIEGLIEAVEDKCSLKEIICSAVVKEYDKYLAFEKLVTMDDKDALEFTLKLQEKSKFPPHYFITMALLLGGKNKCSSILLDVIVNALKSYSENMIKERGEKQSIECGIQALFDLTFHALEQIWDDSRLERMPDYLAELCATDDLCSEMRLFFAKRLYDKHYYSLVAEILKSIVVSGSEDIRLHDVQKAAKGLIECKLYLEIAANGLLRCLKQKPGEDTWSMESWLNHLRKLYPTDINYFCKLIPDMELYFQSIENDGAVFNLCVLLTKIPHGAFVALGHRLAINRSDCFFEAGSAINNLLDKHPASVVYPIAQHVCTYFMNWSFPGLDVEAQSMENLMAAAMRVDINERMGVRDGRAVELIRLSENSSTSPYFQYPLLLEKTKQPIDWDEMVTYPDFYFKEKRVRINPSIMLQYTESVEDFILRALQKVRTSIMRSKLFIDACAQEASNISTYGNNYKKPVAYLEALLGESLGTRAMGEKPKWDHFLFDVDGGLKAASKERLASVFLKFYNLEVITATLMDAINSRRIRDDDALLKGKNSEWYSKEDVLRILAERGGIVFGRKEDFL